jgi:hypothetical protein
MNGAEKTPQIHNDTLVFFVNGKKVIRIKQFYRKIFICRYAWTMWTCVCHWRTIYGMSVCWVDSVHTRVCSASDGYQDRLQRRRLRCVHGGCRHVFTAHTRCRLSIRERLFVSRVRGSHATHNHRGGCARIVHAYTVLSRYCPARRATAHDAHARITVRFLYARLCHGHVWSVATDCTTDM